MRLALKKFVFSWVIAIPIVTIGIEILLHRHQGRVPAILQLAIDTNSQSVLGIAVGAICLTFLTYSLTACFVDFLFRLASLPIVMRPAVFLVLYCCYRVWLWYAYPKFGHLTYGVVLSIAAFGGLCFFAKRFAQSMPLRFQIIWFLGLLALLCFHRSQGMVSERPIWKTTYRPKSKQSTPSVVLLAIDSLPGESFLTWKPSAKVMTPYWYSVWKKKAIHFQNAYTVINSSYTSWMSMLSGRHPVDSDLRYLLPSDRLGEITPSELLPNRLITTGYETIFLTDCRNTSFMEHRFGFQKILPKEKGFFPCFRSYAMGMFPLAWVWNRALGMLEDVRYFCSPLSSGSTFLKDFKRVAKGIAASDKPQFVAAHTCLGHLDYPTLPPKWKNTPLVDSVGGVRFANKRDARHFGAVLNQSDEYLNRILRFLEPLPNTWVIVTADHGVRFHVREQRIFRMSHGVGQPLSRFQYNVPLIIIPPRRHPWSGATHRQLVSLLDIYPTILELANVNVMPDAKYRSLLNKQIEDNRQLTLISSFQSKASKIENVTMDKSGVVKFTEKEEARIRSQQVQATLRLPYRMLTIDGVDRKYHEWNDPHNFHNVATTAGSKRTTLENRVSLP